MKIRTMGLVGLSLFAVQGSAWSLSLGDLDPEKVASGSSKLFKAAKGMSDTDEMALGREVAANLAARYGLIEDETRLHYVNLVGQLLVRQSTRKEIAFHFGILKTPEINALAAPGGYIFVTEGLLRLMQDESELAGVLAHEISHVSEKHIAKALRKANLAGAGEDFASAASGDMQRLSQFTDYTLQLMDKGLSRGDELEADKLGTLLAAKTGYDARGLRHLVERLGKTQTQPTLLAHLNRTHPPVPDRLHAIDDILQSESPTEVRLNERYKKMTATAKS